MKGSVRNVGRQHHWKRFFFGRHTLLLGVPEHAPSRSPSLPRRSVVGPKHDAEIRKVRMTVERLDLAPNFVARQRKRRPWIRAAACLLILTGVLMAVVPTLTPLEKGRIAISLMVCFLYAIDGRGTQVGVGTRRTRKWVRLWAALSAFGAGLIAVTSLAQIVRPGDPTLQLITGLHHVGALLVIGVCLNVAGACFQGVTFAFIAVDEHADQPAPLPPAHDKSTLNTAVGKAVSAVATTVDWCRIIPRATQGALICVVLLVVARLAFLGFTFGGRGLVAQCGGWFGFTLLLVGGGTAWFASRGAGEIAWLQFRSAASGVEHALKIRTQWLMVRAEAATAMIVLAIAAVLAFHPNTFLPPQGKSRSAVSIGSDTPAASNTPPWQEVTSSRPGPLDVVAATNGLDPNGVASVSTVPAGSNGRVVGKDPDVSYSATGSLRGFRSGSFAGTDTQAVPISADEAITDLDAADAETARMARATNTVQQSQFRAKWAAHMIDQQNCAGARELALAEKDFGLVKRVHIMCDVGVP